MRLSLVLAAGVAACGEAPAGGAETGADVSLVVFLSVDQLKPDLLASYDEAFTAGFRRMLDEGLQFADAVHAHAGTSTAPGHATLATGVHPSRHGIVGNSWQERDEDGGDWRSVYSVEDPGAPVLGRETQGRSPRNLRVDGFPDWIQAEYPSSRIVSVSGKDRSAILMAGRTQADVYWFDSRLGQFTTSTYYRSKLPSWVERFNGETLPELYRDDCWRSAVPDAWLHLSRPDTVDYEKDGVHVYFPHCVTEALHRDRHEWFSRTPFLDEATLALAEMAVKELGLGAGERVDYLAVALSATDRVGHRWGPWSRQQLDNLLRLDEALGSLFTLLDSAVGRDRYIVVLSADHGVPALPQHRREQGQPGRYIDNADVRGSPGAPEESEHVAQVIPLEALRSEAAADSFTELYRRSYHPGRKSTRLARDGYELRLTPGTQIRSQGTGHGSPYLYDRRVPLIFVGPGITPGELEVGARTVDAAPTLAHLLSVPAPEGLDGRRLIDWSINTGQPAGGSVSFHTPWLGWSAS